MSERHQNDQEQRSLRNVRVALLALIASSLAFPTVYQPLLSYIWQSLRSWSVYRWSTFETLWTVFCYAAIEVPITAAFIRHPEWRLAQEPQQSGRTKPKGMRRPSRRGYEALVYITPLLIMDLTMIKKFAGVPLGDMLRTGNYDFSNPTTAGGHRATFLVPTLHNFSLQSPLQTERALPAEAPTSRRLIIELIGSLVIYDALFFLFHLALHTLPFLRTWHAPHHRHADIHPQVTNQLHVAERLGLVLLANFSLNIIRSHVLTRTLFVPMFVWLLVDIHNGLDSPPWAYEKILPEGWGGGSKKHAAHHKYGGGGYEPFFNWGDALWEKLTGRPATN